MDFLTCEEIEKMGREEAVELDGLLSFASNMFAPEEKAAIGRVLTGKEPSDRYQPIVAAAAQEIGMAADPSTPAGRLVERTILRGYATLLDELRQEILSIPREIPAQEKKPAEPDGFIFTAFWKEFQQHKLENREWKSDTAANAAGTWNIFDKLFPGVTVAQLIANPIASDLKTKLLLLHRNYARGKRQKMSAEKLLAEGRNLPQRERMQSPTVNKHGSNLAEYWSYLVEKKKIPADIPNPFVGLHITLKKGRKARNERFNWPATLEKELFESPLYTGCASNFTGARRPGMKFIGTRCSGCRCWRAPWAPVKTRPATLWSATSRSKILAKDRSTTWKSMMARIPGQRAMSLLLTWCLGWVFSSNG